MSKRVPEGWSRSTLGKVAKLTMGQSPSSDTYNTENNGLPFFQGNADFGSRYPRVRYWCNEPTKIANEQSILFSVRAPVGEVNIAPYECCIGRGLAAIDGEKVHQEFLYQKLQHAKPQFQLLSQGSTFEAVNGSDLKEFDLVLPPVPEQQKIAAILFSVDDVIEKTRAQIDKLKDLKTGMMQELLTKGIGHTEFKDSSVGRIPIQWKVKTTGQLCKSIVPGRNKPLAMNGDIPWLTINDLGSLYVSESKMGYGVTKKILAQAKGKTVPKRTVIMSCVGDFGVTSVASKEVVINQQLHGFVCGGEIIPEYLCFVLKNSALAMHQLATKTTIPYMNKENCESVLIPVPNIDEQRKITDVLVSVDQSFVELTQKQSLLKMIKKALMQDLLTGTVRVNVD